MSTPVKNKIIKTKEESQARTSHATYIQGQCSYEMKNSEKIKLKHGSIQCIYCDNNYLFVYLN